VLFAGEIFVRWRRHLLLWDFSLLDWLLKSTNSEEGWRMFHRQWKPQHPIVMDKTETSDSDSSSDNDSEVHLDENRMRNIDQHKNNLQKKIQIRPTRTSPISRGNISTKSNQKKPCYQPSAIVFDDGAEGSEEESSADDVGILGNYHEKLKEIPTQKTPQTLPYQSHQPRSHHSQSDGQETHLSKTSSFSRSSSSSVCLKNQKPAYQPSAFNLQTNEESDEEESDDDEDNRFEFKSYQSKSSRLPNTKNNLKFPANSKSCSIVPSSSCGQIVQQPTLSRIASQVMTQASSVSSRPTGTLFRPNSRIDLEKSSSEDERKTQDPGTGKVSRVRPLQTSFGSTVKSYPQHTRPRSTFRPTSQLGDTDSSSDDSGDEKETRRKPPLVPLVTRNHQQIKQSPLEVKRSHEIPLTKSSTSFVVKKTGPQYIAKRPQEVTQGATKRVAPEVGPKKDLLQKSDSTKPQSKFVCLNSCHRPMPSEDSDSSDSSSDSTQSESDDDDEDEDEKDDSPPVPPKPPVAVVSKPHPAPLFTYDMKKSKEDLFFEGCLNGDVEFIENLVKDVPDFDFNFQDDQGVTPLHAACIRGHLPIAQWLVDDSFNQVEICCRDFEGMTPLHFAFENGYAAIALYLV
jgi:hypothetical protein